MKSLPFRLIYFIGSLAIISSFRLSPLGYGPTRNQRASPTFPMVARESRDCHHRPHSCRLLSRHDAEALQCRGTRLKNRYFHKVAGDKSLFTQIRGGAVVLASSTAAPALAVWLGPALLCALAYALYNLFIKKAATNQMDPILGGVLLQFVAALVGSLLWLFQRMRTTTASAASTSSLPNKVAIAWAAAAGLAVGAAELLSFVISGLGVAANKSIPIVVGGSVVLGTLLGKFWLREVLTWKGWCGVALITAGIAMVGIDPGSSGSLH
jgi:transporter family protein